MTKFMLYDLFSVTVTSAISLGLASMALELFMAKKKWITLVRSLAGFFVLLTAALGISYMVHKSIMTVMSGAPITSTVIIYFLFETMLIASFGYLLFWNIRGIIRKIKERTKND